MAGVRIAASGMAWKATESEKVITVSASTIKWAQWLRVARNYQLRIGTVVESKNGSKDQRKEKFDGFQREVGRKTKETWIIKAEHIIS
jgi:structure-specific recognition protein 1